MSHLIFLFFSFPMTIPQEAQHCYQVEPSDSSLISQIFPPLCLNQVWVDSKNGFGLVAWIGHFLQMVLEI